MFNIHIRNCILGGNGLSNQHQTLEENSSIDYTDTAYKLVVFYNNTDHRCALRLHH